MCTDFPREHGVFRASSCHFAAESSCIVFLCVMLLWVIPLQMRDLLLFGLKYGFKCGYPLVKFRAHPGILCFQRVILGLDGFDGFD